jgi:hypothetical protein
MPLSGRLVMLNLFQSRNKFGKTLNHPPEAYHGDRKLLFQPPG